MNFRKILLLSFTALSMLISFDQTDAQELIQNEQPTKPIVFQTLDGAGTGIAGFTDAQTGSTLAGIMSAGYQLLIGIASVLAVVMIFYAGFRYATTVSPGAKSDAKNRILAALGGLLLALSSWLILSTIDDDLVGVEFVFRDFKDGVVVFPIMTESDRARLNNEFGATIVVSATGQHSITDVGTLLDSGKGDVTGIPTKGDYNPTIKKEFPNGNGLEVQMQKVPFRGDEWVTGTTSWFTGPHDTGVSATETGALAACSGILRNVPYTFQGVAIRWNYNLTPPGTLGNKKLVVFSPETNKTAYITPCDWGPGTQVTSGAAIDLTPGACVALGFVQEPRTGGGHLTQLTKNEISRCHGKQVYFRFAN